MNATNSVSLWTGCSHHPWLRVRLFALTMMLAAALHAPAAELNFATDGNDTHDGISLATPFATLHLRPP